MFYCFMHAIFISQCVCFCVCGWGGGLLKPKTIKEIFHTTKMNTFMRVLIQLHVYFYILKKCKGC